MKRNRALVRLAAAAALVLSGSQADAGGLASFGDRVGGEPCEPDAPCVVQNGFYARYEIPILDVDFDSNTAFVEEDFDPDPNVDSSNAVEFEWSDEVSHRVDFGYAPAPRGMGFRARYWHFDAGVEKTGGVPQADFDASIEANLADDPDIDFSSDTGARALQDVTMKVWDFELLSRYDAWSTSFTLGAGVRWARMKQDGLVQELPPTGERLHVGNNYDGVGATFSVEAVRPVLTTWLDNRVRVFTNVRGSFLVGDSFYKGFDADPTVVDIIEIEDEDEFVPVMDLQVGLELAQDTGFGVVALRAGWESQFWFGVGTTGANESLSNDSADFQDQRDSDMSFNGGFVALEFRR